MDWYVTVRGFGNVKSTHVSADSRKEAEEKVLASIGFSVDSKSVPATPDKKAE